MLDFSGRGKLHHLQEKARVIADLDKRLAWLEETLIKEQRAFEVIQKNAGIKALYDNAQFWKSLAPLNMEKRFDEALHEEITRTKELLLMQKIKEAAEAMPDLQKAVHYLIDCKNEYHLNEEYTYFTEQEYKAQIENYIQDMKQNAAQSAPKSQGKPLQWKGTAKDFSELVKALSLTALKGIQETEIIRQLGSVFDFNGKPFNENRHTININELQDKKPNDLFTAKMNKGVNNFLKSLLDKDE